MNLMLALAEAAHRVESASATNDWRARSAARLIREASVRGEIRLGSSVVVEVSPEVWRRILGIGAAHVAGAYALGWMRTQMRVTVASRLLRSAGMSADDRLGDGDELRMPPVVRLEAVAGDRARIDLAGRRTRPAGRLDIHEAGYVPAGTHPVALVRGNGPSIVFGVAPREEATCR